MAFKGSFRRRTKEEIETGKVVWLMAKSELWLFLRTYFIRYARRVSFTVNWFKQNVSFCSTCSSTIFAEQTKITLDIWIISIFFSYRCCCLNFSLFAPRNGHCQVWQMTLWSNDSNVEVMSSSFHSIGHLTNGTAYFAHLIDSSIKIIVENVQVFYCSKIVRVAIN